MNIYSKLSENMKVFELQDIIEPKLHDIQDLIARYNLDYHEKNKIDTLEKLTDLFDYIIEIFQSQGFDYTPEVSPDVSEESFKNILEKFKEQITITLNDFTNDGMTAFYTHLCMVSNAIEVHLSNIRL